MVWIRSQDATVNVPPKKYEGNAGRNANHEENYVKEQTYVKTMRRTQCVFAPTYLKENAL